MALISGGTSEAALQFRTTGSPRKLTMMLTITDTMASHTRFACPFLAIDQHDCLEGGERSVGMTPGRWKALSLWGNLADDPSVMRAGWDRWAGGDSVSEGRMSECYECVANNTVRWAGWCKESKEDYCRWCSIQEEGLCLEPIGVGPTRRCLRSIKSGGRCSRCRFFQGIEGLYSTAARERQ